MGEPKPGRYSHNGGETITYARPWGGDLGQMWNFFGDFDSVLSGLQINRDGTLRVRTPRGDACVTVGTWIVRTVGVDFYDALTVEEFAEKFTPAPLSSLAIEFARVIDRAIGGIDPAHAALSGTSIVEDPEVAEFLRGLNHG